jgi:hypothetical protein
MDFQPILDLGITAKLFLYLGMGNTPILSVRVSSVGVS